MLFAFIAADKPDHLNIRKENRPAHLEWLKKHLEAGRIRIAGPLLATGGDMDGSLLILDVPSRQEADAILAEDPYAKAGLFESTELRAWNWVAGEMRKEERG